MFMPGSQNAAALVMKPSLVEVANVINLIAKDYELKVHVVVATVHEATWWRRDAPKIHMRPIVRGKGPSTNQGAEAWLTAIVGGCRNRKLALSHRGWESVDPVRMSQNKQPITLQHLF